MIFSSAGPSVIDCDMTYIMAAKMIAQGILVGFAIARLHITKVAVAIFGTE